MRLGFCFTLIGVGCLGSTHLLAQPLPPPAPEAQPDDAAIATALREQAGRARTHRYVWTSVNAALAVGSFAVLPVIDRSSRPDYVVAGVGSVLASASTFVFPLRVDSDGAELDVVDRLPPVERHRRLHELLRIDAADERDRLALPWHVVNFGVSALAGGIIALGFRHTLSGVTQGVGSFVLGEAQLFTQPTGLNEARLAGAAHEALAFCPQISIQSRYVSFGLIGTW